MLQSIVRKELLNDLFKPILATLKGVNRYRKCTIQISIKFKIKLYDFNDPIVKDFIIFDLLIRPWNDVHKAITLVVNASAYQVFTIKDTKVTHFWMIKGLHVIAQRWYKYHSNVGFEIIKVHCTSFFSASTIFFKFFFYWLCTENCWVDASPCILWIWTTWFYWSQPHVALRFWSSINICKLKRT